jgi:hypothetical protein
MGSTRSVEAAARTHIARLGAARPARRAPVRSTLAQRLWEAMAEDIFNVRSVRLWVSTDVC